MTMGNDIVFRENTMDYSILKGSSELTKLIYHCYNTDELLVDVVILNQTTGELYDSMYTPYQIMCMLNNFYPVHSWTKTKDGSFIDDREIIGLL